MIFKHYFFLVCWIWIISSSQEVHNSFVALRCKYTKKESFEEKMGILGSSPPHNNPTAAEVMYKCRVDKKSLLWWNELIWHPGWISQEDGSILRCKPLKDQTLIEEYYVLPAIQMIWKDDVKLISFHNFQRMVELDVI